MLAEYFAQLNGAKIVGVTAAVPAHELTAGQFELSKDEYNFLHDYSLDKAESLIQAIRAKMENTK